MFAHVQSGRRSSLRRCRLLTLRFAAASAYFALHGRHRLTLSPEEVFALQQKASPVLEPARS
jgi:hypothetical protein